MSDPTAERQVAVDAQFYRQLAIVAAATNTSISEYVRTRLESVVRSDLAAILRSMVSNPNGE